MSKKRKRIAVDMDEVVADVLPKLLDLYEKEFGKRLTKVEYWGKKVYDLEGAAHLRMNLHEVGFFADLPVIPHAQEVLKELSERYDIFFVTAAMEFRNSLADKWDWAQQHFPFISWKNTVMCGDKSIIKADYMIDDHAKNLRTFSGKGLLFTATHNIDEQQFTRVNDWLEVKAFFESEEG